MTLKQVSTLRTVYARNLANRHGGICLLLSTGCICCAYYVDFDIYSYHPNFGSNRNYLIRLGGHKLAKIYGRCLVARRRPRLLAPPAKTRTPFLSFLLRCLEEDPGLTVE